jgi:hypothetical protein
MEISVVPLTKKRLQEIPNAERVAIVLMGHASNEINLFRKYLLIASQHSESGNRIVDQVQAAQSLILMRLLLGKCFEAWLMLSKRVLPLRDKYLPLMPHDAHRALETLGKAFADGRLASIRNQLSFHYADDKNLVESHWQDLPDNDPWDYYLSQRNINSFYFASELVIAYALTNLALPNDAKNCATRAERERIGFTEACNLTNEISYKMISVLGEFIAAITLSNIPDLDGYKVDIGEAGKFSELALPYFWDDDDFLRTLGLSGEGQSSDN